MSQRVVITGFGGLGSTGADVNSLFDAVKKGETGIDRIQQWDVSGWEYPLGAELKEYNPRKMVADRKLLKVLSRHDVIGLNAASQAVDHSDIINYRDSLTDPTEFNDRTGVYVASPGIKFNQQYDLLPLFTHAKRDLKRYAEALFDTIHPMWLLRILSNNVLAYTGIQYQFKGPNQNITNHAVSGTQAMGEAARMVKDGNIDRAIVVAYEAGLEPQGQVYYAGIGALSKTGLKPFSANRDGTVLAEGAGAMMIESLETALERGATIYAEILADSCANEAMGIFPIREDGDGLQRAMNLALEHADLKPDDIGMITAHANGTVNSDASEAKAIANVFGENSVPVTGFKWSLGHNVAGAGVLETILTLLALQEEKVPGIHNLETIDKACEVINVSCDQQDIRSKVAMTITRGFSSMNACLLLRAWDE